MSAWRGAETRSLELGTRDLCLPAAVPSPPPPRKGPEPRANPRRLRPLGGDPRRQYIFVPLVDSGMVAQPSARPVGAGRKALGGRPRGFLGPAPPPVRRATWPRMEWLMGHLLRARAPRRSLEATRLPHPRRLERVRGRARARPRPSLRRPVDRTCARASSPKRGLPSNRPSIGANASVWKMVARFSWQLPRINCEWPRTT